MTEAKNVILAAGLPCSFFSAQKDQFKEYLLKKKTLNFSYEGEKGWYLIMADGFSTGWGKLAGGIMKNHYPKGLRKMW